MGCSSNSGSPGNDENPGMCNIIKGQNDQNNSSYHIIVDNIYKVYTAN